MVVCGGFSECSVGGNVVVGLFFVLFFCSFFSMKIKLATNTNPTNHRIEPYVVDDEDPNWDEAFGDDI